MWKSFLKSIFKLQDLNLLLNSFWSFFQIWNEVLSKNSNLTKTFILSTFWTITLGVCKLLINDIIQELMKLGGSLFFMRIVFKWSIWTWNVLKSQRMLKILWSNVFKSPLIWYIRKKLSQLVKTPLNVDFM